MNTAGNPYVLLLARIYLAALFLAAGIGKVIGFATAVGYMGKQGLPMPQVMAMAAIAVEIGGALLLIVPGRAAFGSVLLAGVMAGAVVAHLTVLHTAPTAPLVLFALTALISWGRRTQLAVL